MKRADKMLRPRMNLEVVLKMENLLLNLVLKVRNKLTEYMSKMCSCHYYTE